MRVRALGPIALVDADGAEVPVRSRPQRVVLGLLVAHRRSSVSADRLVDALWDVPPESARASLRSQVSRLRRSLGDAVAIVPGGYRLDLADDDVDAWAFEAALEDGPRASWGAGPGAAPDGETWLDGDHGAEPGSALADLARLDGALDLWRGPAFGDLADHEHLRGSAVRLQELRSAALEARLPLLCRAGRADDAVAAARRLLAEAQQREPRWVALVLALHHAGRQADALRAFQQAASALAEAGLEPSDELRAAEALALAGRPVTAGAAAPAGPHRPARGTDGPAATGGATSGTTGEVGAGAPDGRPHRSPAPVAVTPDGEAAAPTSVDGAGPGDGAGRPAAPAVGHLAPAGNGPPSTLPRARSSFVGRDRELDVVPRLLAEHRLVTLVGPGGVGKTRLALEVARLVEADGRRRAQLAALGGLAEPGQVAAAVVDAIGVAPGAGPDEALAAAGSAPLLVVLDNAEHLLDEVARVADLLLGGGSEVQVLATSRERLGVDGEQVWSVAPLPATGEAPAARALFLDRLRALVPDRPVAEADLVAVDAVTDQLDGLPLAIEMAAARAAVVPLPELAATLGQHLGSLQAPRRGTDARHRTLAAVVEWSEALLDEDDRRLLADLAVLAGRAPLADVAALRAPAADGAAGRDPGSTGAPASVPTGAGGDDAGPPDLAGTAAGLAGLVERSMAVVDRSGGEARYGLLATVRQHVSRRGGSADRRAAEARHGRHFVAVADTAGRAVLGGDEGEARRRLLGVVDELRQAHRWAAAHDPVVAGTLSTALHLWATSCMRAEPRRWASDLLATTPFGDLAAASPSAAAGTAGAAALHAAEAGDIDAARALVADGVAVGAGTFGGAVALVVATDLALFAGDLAEVDRLSEQTIAAGWALGLDYVVVEGAVNASLARAYAGDGEAALAVLDELAPRRPPASPSGRAWLAYTRGEVLLDREPDLAQAHLARAVALADEVGNRYISGVATVSACSLRARVGPADDPSTAAAFVRLLERWRREGAVLYQVTTLRNLVTLLQRQGRAGPVAELLGTVSASDRYPTFGAEADRLAAADRWAVEVLGADAHALARAAGADRDVDAAARRARDWLAVEEGDAR